MCSSLIELLLRVADALRIDARHAHPMLVRLGTPEEGVPHRRFVVLAGSLVNVEGGAIAHGHPIGATGAVLTVRLIHGMQRDSLKRGIVTLCIGGGQGVALALERIPS